MLDWLNVKAWLSAAVLILIVTTGAWIEREQDHFEEKQLEAYLDSFVGIVDKAVLVHGSLFIEINFTDDAKAGSGITIPSRFKNQLYEIILTERNAVFLQGSLRFSREFEQDVLLIGPESNSLKSIEMPTLMKMN